jgi:hypothetical protein
MVLQLQGQWAQEWAHAQAQLTRAQEQAGEAAEGVLEGARLGLGWRLL